jgi:hypothetical protein
MYTNKDRYKWLSVLVFAILLIGLALYLGLAGLMLLSSGFELISPQSGAGLNTGTNFIIASGLGFCGLIMLPAVLFSFQRMRGKSIRPFQTRPVNTWQVISMGAGWIGAILLSDYLYQNFSLGWLVAAPFYVISIGLPLVLLVWIGLGGIPLGSRNRFWGSLGIGMTVSGNSVGIFRLPGHSCDPDIHPCTQSKLAGHPPAFDLTDPRSDRH